MARKGKGTALLDVPCEFKNVNIGDKTARIGVAVDRGELSVTDADKKLCEQRLSGRIVAKPPGSHGDQGALDGMEDDQIIDAVFDCKGYGVSSDSISFGLTFMLASVDIATLSHFAKRGGRLIVNEAEDLPAGVDADGEADE
jgi:hypothetical protein